MTARLVALMSSVLFLSLLAFSLLLNHSRTAILEEVERTVSRVGSQTLHAVLGGEEPAKPIAGNRMEFHSTQLFPVNGMPPETVDMLLRLNPQDQSAAVARNFVFQPDPVVPIPGSQSTAENAAQSDRVGQWVVDNHRRRVVIAHDRPRTALRGESEEVMQVAITMLYTEGAYYSTAGDTSAPRSDDATKSSAAPTSARAMELTQVAADATELAPPTAVRGELVFDVPVAEYARVFDAVRERTLWLFIGVLVVGIALSTALARRFTRPIRELDEALQRVTAGDLAVAVHPGGGPEVGRLAVAFNRMTSELRANRERERELIRREKLSALGRLAAGVAHDVRNPLHSIGLTLQNLEETCRPDAADERGVFERSVGLIRREIKRLDGLVSGFLSFARSEADAKQEVRLPELVRETAALVAKEAERREITVVVDAEPALEAIPAAPASLRSAILNLVLNAFEATPAGGTVTLRVMASGDTHAVEVSDTGKGIKDEDKERIFDFGYTTREGGTGLGLAMVHHTVVEEHGGRIAIDSAEGRGTRVRLELPVRRSEA
jgi:signal transduction histidine kinase